MFSIEAIDDLLTDLKNIVTYYNQSNLFTDALRKAQMEVMHRAESECYALLHDVKTRWNSQFTMIKSFVRVKEALLHVLELPKWKSCKSLVRNFSL